MIPRRCREEKRQRDINYDLEVGVGALLIVEEGAEVSELAGTAPARLIDFTSSKVKFLGF